MPIIDLYDVTRAERSWLSHETSPLRGATEPDRLRKQRYRATFEENESFSSRTLRFIRCDLSISTNINTLAQRACDESLWFRGLRLIAGQYQRRRRQEIGHPSANHTP